VHDTPVRQSIFEGAQVPGTLDSLGKELELSKRTYIGWAVLLSALFLGSLLAACGAGAGGGEEARATLDGPALVQERCTQCHDLGRVESAKKTPEAWRTTVERMVSRGAQLNQAEEEAVIAYLSEAYPE
jgi:hypothetical protein